MKPDANPDWGIEPEYPMPDIPRRVLKPATSWKGTPVARMDLVARCAKLVDRLRFDATALPIHAIAFEAGEGGVQLIVDIRVPDRDKPHPPLDWNHIWRTLVCPWEVLEGNGPDYLVRWMRETIANTLAHEVDESITLGGERVFDPHRALRSTG